MTAKNYIFLLPLLLNMLYILSELSKPILQIFLDNDLYFIYKKKSWLKKNIKKKKKHNEENVLVLKTSANYLAKYSGCLSTSGRAMLSLEKNISQIKCQAAKLNFKQFQNIKQGKPESPCTLRHSLARVSITIFTLLCKSTHE